MNFLANYETKQHHLNPFMESRGSKEHKHQRLQLSIRSFIGMLQLENQCKNLDTVLATIGSSQTGLPYSSLQTLPNVHRVLRQQMGVLKRFSFTPSMFFALKFCMRVPIYSLFSLTQAAVALCIFKD